MTCREKLAMEHPEEERALFKHTNIACPSAYGYLPDPINGEEGMCAGLTCEECWEREIPEETESESRKAVEIGQALVVKATTPKILDSGDRTEFATGAVRDMREGKGRCDLLPLAQVAVYLALFYDKLYAVEILLHIRDYQASGDVEYLYKALKIFESHSDWKDPYTMFLEVAKHFEEGCNKYGENNWRKGIPVKFYIDSALRHYFKYLRGDNDEPHDRAFCWNILCCIWTIENIKQEDDSNDGEERTSDDGERAEA